MSFLYDPRRKRPQLWTYPVFILISLGLFWGFYSYSEKKAAQRGAVPPSAESDKEY